MSQLTGSSDLQRYFFVENVHCRRADTTELAQELEAGQARQRGSLARTVPPRGYRSIDLVVCADVHEESLVGADEGEDDARIVVNGEAPKLVERAGKLVGPQARLEGILREALELLPEALLETRTPFDSPPEGTPERRAEGDVGQLSRSARRVPTSEDAASEPSSSS